MNDQKTPPLIETKIIESDHTRFVVGIGLLLLSMAIVFWPGGTAGMQPQSGLEFTPSPGSATQTPLPSSTPSPQPSTTPTITPTFEPLTETFPSAFGALVLSIEEERGSHLFAYQPMVEMSPENGLQALPLTRLTEGNQDDIHPAVHPDGTMIAFASNRSGPWDIYLLDLQSGELERFTNTVAYEGNPTWSPDGKWLAYESYQNQNYDIIIQDINQDSGPINLTNHPAPDHSPHWSGQGRRISFVSLRSGTPQIWIANLDSPEVDKAERVTNYTQADLRHPCWSADGRYLTWSIASGPGNHSLYTWDSQRPGESPRAHGTGDWPLWGGQNGPLFSLVRTPRDTYLTAYIGGGESPQILLPAVKMPGDVKGFSWAAEIQLAYLQGSGKGELALGNSPDPGTNTEISKKQLLSIGSIKVPYPQLNQNAVDAFQRLRSEAAEQLGWDFLSTLENAYVPLTEPLDPGLERNWLYTGRAIMVSDLPRRAGWMVIVREDFGSEIYWRMYLRTSNQQGYQGRPIKDLPWDFDARLSGDNFDYENGGKLAATLPKGYYVDFTKLAEAYGFERLPASLIWQSSPALARFQKFVYRENLAWWDAMMELHSPGAVRDQLGIEGP